MRPIPIPNEVVASMNMGESDPKRYQKITMNPPEGSDNCEPVEVVVDTYLAQDQKTKEILRVPRQFIAKIQVTTSDIEQLEKHGFFWLALWGDHMQPFAVFPEEDEEVTPVTVLWVEVEREDGERYGYKVAIPPGLVEDAVPLSVFLTEAIVRCAGMAETWVGVWTCGTIEGILIKPDPDEGGDDAST